MYVLLCVMYVFTTPYMHVGRDHFTPGLFPFRTFSYPGYFPSRIFYTRTFPTPDNSHHGKVPASRKIHKSFWWQFFIFFVLGGWGAHKPPIFVRGLGPYPAPDQKWLGIEIQTNWFSGISGYCFWIRLKKNSEPKFFFSKNSQPKLKKKIKFFCIHHFD